MPKNIIILSDGTGNSAGKYIKTNVWRTYQAIELGAPTDPKYTEQVAYYHDGVGTGSFKPFAAVASAFGFGLMQSVKNMYTFLCRTYEPNDRIFASSFSRGAFSIRLFVSFIARCGIIQSSNEEELRRFVSYAYAAFMRDYRVRTSKVRHTLYDYFATPVTYHVDDGNRIRLEHPSVFPRIAFLGLWDTVDAYGMPVEELRLALEWLWPISFVNRDLENIVDVARHALSLDEERSSFSPVLWNDLRPHNSDRLSQMWFAGVHANVGGGYPIDDLAHVSLVWMLREAIASGLRLLPNELQRFASIANAHGRIYDSRSGIAACYRYSPRSVTKLCCDHFNNVWIDKPEIHASVSERIARRQTGYAPISLPPSLINRNDEANVSYTYDHLSMNLAWDSVWWRRIVYYVALLTTTIIITMPILDLLYQKNQNNCNIKTPFIGPWICALMCHPNVSFLLAALLVWLLFFENIKLQQQIVERSERAWASIKGLSQPPCQETRGLDRVARRIRFSPICNQIARAAKFNILPGALGQAIVLLFFYSIVKCIYLIVEWLPPINAIVLVIISGSASTFYFFRNTRRRSIVATKIRVKAPDGRGARRFDGMACLDPNCIDAFKLQAAQAVDIDGRTILEVYRKDVLFGSELLFILSLGAFGFFSAICAVRLFPESRLIDAIFIWQPALLFSALGLAGNMLTSKLLATTAASTKTTLTFLRRLQTIFLIFAVPCVLLFVMLVIVGWVFKRMRFFTSYDISLNGGI